MEDVETRVRRYRGNGSRPKAVTSGRDRCGLLKASIEAAVVSPSYSCPFSAQCIATSVLWISVAVISRLSAVSEYGEGRRVTQFVLLRCGNRHGGGCCGGCSHCRIEAHPQVNHIALRTVTNCNCAAAGSDARSPAESACGVTGGAGVGDGNSPSTGRIGVRARSPCSVPRRIGRRSRQQQRSDQRQRRQCNGRAPRPVNCRGLVRHHGRKYSARVQEGRWEVTLSRP